MRTSNPRPPPEAPNCTTDMTAPYVDFAITTAMFVGGLWAAIESTRTGDESRKKSLGAVGTLGVLGSFGFGASYYVGRARVERCRAAQPALAAGRAP